MDIVTQAALGAVVGSVVAGRKMGGRALWVGAAVAVLPDSDVIISPFLDDTTRLLTHRSATHSLLVMPIVALLLATIVSRVRHGFGLSFRRWFLLFFWCFVTHILLDWCTVYGTQLFFPITDKAYALSIVFIVDLFYTLPLLAVIIWLVLRRPPPMRMRNIAITGLAISTAYLLLAVASKWYADSRIVEALTAYGQVERRITYNSPMNIVLWQSIAMTGSGYLTAEYSLLGCGDVIVREKVGHPARARVLELAEKHRDIGRLLWFSRGFFKLIEDNDDLIFIDLRFGYEDVHPFRYKIASLTDGELQVDEHASRMKTEMSDMDSRFDDLWKGIVC